MLDFKAKIHQIRFDLAGELTATPNPLAVFNGPILLRAWPCLQFRVMITKKINTLGCQIKLFLASELLVCGTTRPLIQLALHLLLMLRNPLCVLILLHTGNVYLSILSTCLFDIVMRNSPNVLHSCKLVNFPLLFYFSGSCKCMPLCPAVLSALSSSCCCLFDVFQTN